MGWLTALKPYSGAMTVGIVFIVAPLLLGSYLTLVVAMIAATAIGAIGLSLLIGPLPRHGHPLLFSFGQSAFVALGAYVTAIAQERWHLNFFASLLLAVVLAMILALIIALPGSRLAGLGLGLVTFALGFTFEMLARGSMLVDFTHGNFGVFPRPADLFGLNLSSGLMLYYMVAGFLILSMLVGTNVVQSQFGQCLRVMTRSELVAASFGVRLVWQKAVIFAIAGVYGAVSGALLAQIIGHVSPDIASAHISVRLFAMVIIGGAGSIIGPVIGAAFFVGLPEFINALEKDSAIFFAAVLLAILILAPRGILGLVEDFRASRRRVAWETRQGAQDGARVGQGAKRDAAHL